MRLQPACYFATLCLLKPQLCRSKVWIETNLYLPLKIFSQVICISSSKDRQTNEKQYVLQHWRFDQIYNQIISCIQAASNWYCLKPPLHLITFFFFNISKWVFPQVTAISEHQQPGDILHRWDTNGISQIIMFKRWCVFKLWNRQSVNGIQLSKSDENQKEMYLIQQPLY